jgi:hypothetical protein
VVRCWGLSSQRNREAHPAATHLRAQVDSPQGCAHTAWARAETCRPEVNAAGAEESRQQEAFPVRLQASCNSQESSDWKDGGQGDDVLSAAQGRAPECEGQEVPEADGEAEGVPLVVVPTGDAEPRVNPEGWQHTWLWSDEKWFEVGGVQGNERMWVEADDPDPDERYVGKAAHPTKVHVWATICSSGRSSLHIHSGSINSQVYIDCIEQAFLPCLYDKEWLALDKRTNYVFQYDGASCHNSKLTLGWLRKHLPRHITALKRAEWPANSPDLSPIETLWNYLQNAVIEKQAETVEQLKVAVVDAWWEIPLSTIQHVIDGVTKKIEKCIDREGGRTNTR